MRRNAQGFGEKAKNASQPHHAERHSNITLNVTKTSPQIQTRTQIQNQTSVDVDVRQSPELAVLSQLGEKSQ
jgi:hypothetical protein